MKFEPFEIIDSNVNSTASNLKNEILSNNQSILPLNKLKINPQILNTITQTILPLFNNLSNIPKDEDKNKIETNDYVVKSDRSTFPTTNPQFDFNSVFNNKEQIMKQPTCKCKQNSNDFSELQTLSKIKSKQAIENQFERHRNLVEYIKSNNSRN